MLVSSLAGARFWPEEELGLDLTTLAVGKLKTCIVHCNCISLHIH